MDVKLAEIGTFLGGIAAIVNSVYLIIKERKEDKVKEMGIGKRSGITLFIGILLVFVSGVLYAARPVKVGGISINEKLTTAAWDFYNINDYKKSLALANECIDKYNIEAEKEQANLIAQGTPVPPVGKVSEKEKIVLLQRGLLNDVATCYYIAGLSSVSLGFMEDAKKYFRNATRFTYARTWDPKGWFWSPSKAANEEILKIK